MLQGTAIKTGLGLRVFGWAISVTSIWVMLAIFSLSRMLLAPLFVIEGWNWLWVKRLPAVAGHGI